MYVPLSELVYNVFIIILSFQFHQCGFNSIVMYNKHYVLMKACSYNIRQTHTHPFNGPFSGTTQVSQYQKGKTNLDFTEARDSEWQWHQHR